MEKTLKIGDQELKLKATASTVIRYNEKFGRDMIVDLNSYTTDAEYISGDQLTCYERVAYIMALQADSTIPSELNDWLDSFDVFPIGTIIIAVRTLWEEANGTLSKAKKK